MPADRQKIFKCLINYIELHCILSTQFLSFFRCCFQGSRVSEWSTLQRNFCWWHSFVEPEVLFSFSLSIWKPTRFHIKRSFSHKRRWALGIVVTLTPLENLFKVWGWMFLWMWSLYVTPVELWWRYQTILSGSTNYNIFWVIFAGTELIKTTFQVSVHDHPCHPLATEDSKQFQCVK